MKIIIFFVACSCQLLAIETQTFWQSPSYTQALKLIKADAQNLSTESQFGDDGYVEGQIYGIVACLPTLQHDGMAFTYSAEALTNETSALNDEANLLFTLEGPNPPPGYYTDFIQGEINGTYQVVSMLENWNNP